MAVPVYDYPKKGYSQEGILQILCDPKPETSLICSIHPVSVENNIAFVIDKLKNPSDVQSDDLGAWICKGSQVLTFTVRVTCTSCTLVSLLSDGAIEIKVRRQYFVNRSDSDLHCMIAFLEDTTSKGNN